MSTFKYVDLFAGMGGMRLGLEQALKELDIKGECILTSEIKPFALQVYKDNFGDENIVGDITQIKTTAIPNFDMLLAGFPCFTGDTPVLTSKGYKRIDNIKKGTKVYTHTGELHTVVNTFNNGIHKITKINIEKIGEIETTFNHKFLVLQDDSLEWIPCSKIKTGSYACILKKNIKNTNIFEDIPQEIKNLDTVNNYNNLYVFCKILSVNEMDYKKQVYDIEVETDHSFIAKGVVVHNCQPFSSAGKQLGFEDTRGTLFFEIARILKDKQPKYFLLENVENLVIHDRKDKSEEIGNTLKIILATLEELGYFVTWKVLKASDFGVPQIRKRIYIAGCKTHKIELDNFNKKTKVFGDIQEIGIKCKQTEFSKKLFNYLKENNLPIEYLYDKSIRDKRGKENNLHSWNIELRGETTIEQRTMLEKLVYERRRKDYAKEKKLPLKDGVGLTIQEMKNIYNGTSFEQDINYLLSCGYIKKEFLSTINEYVYDINGGRLSYEFTKILDPNKLCLTLVATDATKLGVIDNDSIRKLTIKECLKLNGYPEDYKMSNISYSQSINLLGNTVVVPVIKEVCKKILIKY